jgi:hypothetical protein
MSKSHNHKVNFTRGDQLLMPPAAGCSEDSEAEEPFRDLTVTGEAEASLEEALRTLDSDDIVIIHDEGSARMEIRVALDQFAELARGFRVEMNLEVKLPDGTVTRHELDWTSGEDLEVPRIALPAREMGRYEMALISLAINGRTILDERARFAACRCPRSWSYRYAPRPWWWQGSECLRHPRQRRPPRCKMY